MRIRSTLLTVAGAVALLAGPLAGAAAADAPDDDERVTSYTADLTVDGDGGLTVREEIVYDFGSEGNHGLQRFIPVRAPYDQTHDRSYPVRDLQVTSPTGTADQVQTDVEDGFLDVRVGDPDRDDVTGEQTYVLSYRVPAVVDELPDGRQQIAWDAVGTGWPVPIDRVDVRLHAPGQVSDQRCLTGVEASTDPCEASATGDGAVFSAAGLGEEEGVTVAGTMPAGTVAASAPLLIDTFSPARAFTVDGGTLGASAAVLVVGAGGLLWARRRPRDTTKAPVSVTDVPPGVLGTLVHGGARDVDVVATLLDLAQRGHLVIEELTGEAGQVRDWALHRRPRTGALSTAEQRLLAVVFADGDDTTLSDVRTTAQAGTRLTKDHLEDDAVARGLFTARPRRVLGHWLLAGLAVVVVGVVATVLLARFTTAGLVGIAAVAVGVAALVVGLAGGARSPLTPLGRDVREQAHEFAGTLARYGDVDALADGGVPERFSRLLPYAVALGATGAWVAGARALEAVDAPLRAPQWYAGPAYAGSSFNVAVFAGAMGGFSAQTSDALSAAPPTTASTSSFSGGGGFTGGAAGGGGGGSW